MGVIGGLIGTCKNCSNSGAKAPVGWVQESRGGEELRVGNNSLKEHCCKGSREIGRGTGEQCRGKVIVCLYAVEGNH